MRRLPRRRARGDPIAGPRLPAAGTRAAAIAALLTSRATIFTPTDLAAWLAQAGDERFRPVGPS